MIKGMIGIISSLFRWFGKKVDFSDIVGLAGLALVFYGVYQWKPFLAYIIVGGIIFLLAIMSNIRPSSRMGG